MNTDIHVTPGFINSPGLRLLVTGSVRRGGVWHGDGGEGGAAAEGVVVDGGEAGGEGDAGERGAEVEGVLADGGDKAFLRLLPDPRHRARHGQPRAFFEAETTVLRLSPASIRDLQRAGTTRGGGRGSGLQALPPPQVHLSNQPPSFKELQQFYDCQKYGLDCVDNDN